MSSRFFLNFGVPACDGTISLKCDKGTKEFYFFPNSPPVGISRRDGGRNGLSSQGASTVQISPAEDDDDPPKTPVGAVVPANKVK